MNKQIKITDASELRHHGLEEGQVYTAFICVNDGAIIKNKLGATIFLFSYEFEILKKDRRLRRGDI